ncbi:MAG: hypothetical protein R6X02_33395 [Enhygromyxa sp.]
MFSSRLVVTAAFLAATATLAGCTEEDTRLFDETGVWTLERYSLDGGPYVDIAQIRKNLFLLRFKPDDGVVAAAACHEQNTEVNVNASSCLNAGLSQWSCQCFSYTYENNRMVWQEFTPGEAPPPVGAVGGDGETDGAEGGGAHELFLAAPAGTTSTYEFSSLPPGLFNSDGMLSKHVFQIKADSVWTGVDKNEDGTLDLEACSQSCFPSGH